MGMDFLNKVFLGRPIRDELTALAVLAGGILVSFVIRAVATALLRRRTEKHVTADTGLVAFGLNAVRAFLYPALILASLYGAVDVIGLEGRAQNIGNAVFVVLFSLLVIRFVVSITNETFRRAAERQQKFDFTRFRPIRSIVVFVIWIAGLLFLLDNLGFDITAVVAGLGIGGIAVALAAQALLGDLFSYFVILFDRPFEIGDFLIFGDVLGSVEKIGIKSTRIRSLSGEQISVSNSDLTSSRVRNYKRMEKRRVVFRIGVVYGTPAEKLRLIPQMIREIIEQCPIVAFDRVHFASYADWNLSFECVYNVLTPDYNLFMDIQQDINLKIYEKFEEEGIEFAFPTHTVKLSGPDSGSRPPRAPGNVSPGEGVRIASDEDPTAIG